MTTSYLLEAGLLHADHKVGLIGTTGTRINREPVPTKLTTRLDFDSHGRLPQQLASEDVSALGLSAVRGLFSGVLWQVHQLFEGIQSRVRPNA